MKQEVTHVRLYKCPACGGEFVYWDSARCGKDDSVDSCPFCGLVRGSYEKLSMPPWFINLEGAGIVPPQADSVCLICGAKPNEQCCMALHSASEYSGTTAQFYCNCKRCSPRC